MDKRQELQTIVLSEYTTADQKKAAQIALDALDNPAPVATRAPTPAPKTKQRHYMDWIPEPTPEECIAFQKLHDDLHADIQRRLALEKAEAAVKIVVPAPTRKERLLAVVDDATSSETQTLEAKLELATLEIDEFHEARARRRMGDAMPAENGNVLRGETI